MKTKKNASAWCHVGWDISSGKCGIGILGKENSMVKGIAV